MEQLYIALIHKDADSDFGVSFPDFPGCVTAGTTVDEAFAMAKEALAGHVEAMIEEGIDVPSPPENIVAAVTRYAKKGEAPVLVPLARDDKAIRVNVTLPGRLLRRIDEHSDNRSGFLAEAAEEKLAGAGAKSTSRRRSRTKASAQKSD